MNISRLVTILLVSVSFTSFSQNKHWMDEAGILSTDSYQTICTKAEQYFEAHPELTVQQTMNGQQYDSQYKKFLRWQWYWRNRLDENGNIPSLTLQDFAEAKKVHSTGSNRSAWTNINQTQSGNNQGYDGMGRATSIGFHPTNANEFIVSGAIGGIWHTTNGGNSYTAIGDNLPYMAVSDVLYHPNDPQTLYVATGDYVWYGLPSLGLLKSTDFGQTWNSTGLSFSLSANDRIRKLTVNPENGETIFAATNNGLMKSMDGGANWQSVNVSGVHWDVLYHPSDTTIVYTLGEVSNALEVFKSTDGGQTFTQVSTTGAAHSIYSPSFLSIAPSDPDYIYYLNGSDEELYKSTNGGNSFTLVNGAVDAIDGLIVSNQNRNHVYVGDLNNYKSTNGGNSFSQETIWWNSGNHPTVHADTRRILTNPLQSDLVYVCNDGGVYIYNETNDSWTEKTDGLVIMQYYSVAVTEDNPDRVMGGTQDNGTRIRKNNGTWKAGNGGDGMECAIDNVDDNIIYCTYVNGQLYRSFDGWTNDTYWEITPTDINGDAISGNWVTPFVLDPSDNTNVVGGYDEVYHSSNFGDTWIKISNNLFNGNVREVAVSPADGNYIYASYSSLFEYTPNLGMTWIQRFVPTSKEITSIALHPTDTNKIWVGVDGYLASHKVFYSDDAGVSWSNIGSGLPNVPVNKVVYQNGGNGLLYAGTDMGVYFYDGSSWQPYNNGLPLTQVLDIEINYTAQKMLIGTHGRGIWQADLHEPLVGLDEAEPLSDWRVYPNPNNGEILYLDVDTQPEQVIIYDPSMREIARYSNTNRVDVSQMSNGMYLIQLKLKSELSAIQSFVISK